ncbi:hypothetical protein B0J13DRAFT_646643 [Dactylonectria estremocensis]|uniref:Uncharacterized protein n=1 Tax=Dactylonectria estremocensis TaxID=1079267 RepID=A0A9P9ILA5_9HYPO|nr:hypothetical protein B0J13DRAFT_646643 [Dactylonectria estremocensis]
MSDRRGAYVLLSGNDTKTDGRISRTFSWLGEHMQPVRQKRRFLLLLSCTVLVTLVVLCHPAALKTSRPPTDQHLERLAGTHLAHLSAPLTGHGFSTLHNETAFIVGKHHAVLGRYSRDYQWVEPESRLPFKYIMRTNGMNNNAMGRMPAGSPYDVLVVARGRNDLYIDPTEKISYANLTIVGFFANFNPTTKTWVRAGPEPYVLELPIWRQFPRPCKNLVNGGAADPRFMWSDAGEPLAVIGTSSRVPGVCKAVGLADLRAVWPGLKAHLEEIGYGHIPIRFDNFTEVGKEGKKMPYEKNWAPFFPGPEPATPITQNLPWYSSLFGSRRTIPATPSWPLFASQIANRSIVEVDTSLDTNQRSPSSYVLAKEIDLSLHVNDTVSMADSSCLMQSLPHSWDPRTLHQATPLYRVTFCPRDTCVPSRENTVLLGLIHRKMGRRSYRRVGECLPNRHLLCRMFVTMSTEAPFQILSVSPPLHFGSVEIDHDVVFSVSMAFFPTKSVGELAEGESPFRESQDLPGGYLGHGWLDDTIVIGAGLRDEAYDSIHLPMSTALRGHTLCSSGV